MRTESHCHSSRAPAIPHAFRTVVSSRIVDRPDRGRRSAPLLRTATVLTRRKSDSEFEGSREVTLAGEAACLGDIDDGRVCLAEQSFCSFDAAFDDVTVWWCAELLGERRSKCVGADPGLCGEAFQAEVFVECRFDEVADVIKAGTRCRCRCRRGKLSVARRMMAYEVHRDHPNDVVGVQPVGWVAAIVARCVEQSKHQLFEHRVGETQRGSQLEHAICCTDHLGDRVDHRTSQIDELHVGVAEQGPRRRTVRWDHAEVPGPKFEFVDAAFALDGAGYGGGSVNAVSQAVMREGTKRFSPRRFGGQGGVGVVPTETATVDKQPMFVPLGDAVGFGQWKVAFVIIAVRFLKDVEPTDGHNR